jgi:hypothetical protein
MFYARISAVLAHNLQRPLDSERCAVRRHRLLESVGHEQDKSPRAS